MATNKLKRTVAVETSLLLARLTLDYGMSHADAVRETELALARSYYGYLPDGYAASIVEVE